MPMLIIANPTSRAGRGRKLWACWQEALTSANVKFYWHVTGSDADCMAAAASAENIVVAAGGDGTINSVLNGVMQTGGRCVMGVLYAGTSPDFCRFHNISPRPEIALQTLLTGAVKPVDVAEIAYRDAAGKSVRRYFACSGNVGMGADVAAFANKYRKYLGDALGTGLGLFKALLFHRRFAAELTLDDERFVFKNVNHIMALKNPYIASGLKVSAKLEPDDGRLLLVVIHGYPLLKRLGLAKALYKGTLLQKPGVFARFCSHAEIAAEPCQTVEFDGDPHGFTPTAITVKPKALSLIGSVD